MCLALSFSFTTSGESVKGTTQNIYFLTCMALSPFADALLPSLFFRQATMSFDTPNKTLKAWSQRS
jgi:hypothetical protein